MKTRAVVTSWHNYTPMYDHKYFNVLSDYFLHNFNKYWIEEVDKLYILDSNWGINVKGIDKVIVKKSDPNLRYWEAYKKVLPQVEEDLVLFMDNDMVVYREEVVENTFKRLEDYGVVSIYDSCGTYKTDKLNGKNKFCLYWFAAKKDLLMNYLDVDWGPHLPHSETLGLLTEKMLDDGVRPFEIEEDKTSIYFDGTQDGEKGKDLGYYHQRGGSTPAYLLTHRNFGNKQTYEAYLKNQPRRETLRLAAWYQIMEGDPRIIYHDFNIYEQDWKKYIDKFKNYHAL